MHPGKLLLSAALAIVIFMAACTAEAPAPPPSKEPSNTLASLQQNGNLSLRFYALMTLKHSETNVIVPSEFLAQSVPIEWMDVIFNGKTEIDGTDYDTIDQVHGTATSDGVWLNEMTFFKQIMWKNSGTIFRLSLRNIPIAKMVDGVPTELGTFEKTGADVQRFVSKIEYLGGPLSGGEIFPTTTFVSIDWKASGRGQTPALKVTFSKGTGGQKM